MRVLIVSQYFWPESFRINELVTALHAKGFEIEVLTGKPNYPDGFIFEGYSAWGCKSELWFGVTVHRVPLVPRGKSAFRLALNYFSFIITASIYGPYLLRNRRFDAIFVFGVSPILQAIPAIVLGWFKDCPVLLWVQDLWPESLTATGYITQRWLLRVVELVVSWIYKKVDLLLVQSRAFMPRVRALAKGTPIVYYPNSFIEVEVDSLPQQINYSEFNCDFPVLFAGNLGTAQAVHVILDAATLLKNVEGIRFLIAGDGSRLGWMQQQVDYRSLNNIVFLGRYPVEVMPMMMRRAAALLVTLANLDILRLTIPSKVQAYLAAGRPIIACLNGAGADVVKEACAGIVVPAEDASALAKAIYALYKTPEQERLKMGMCGRSYYEEHFSKDKLVGELIRHLNLAVRQHKGLFL